MAINLGFGGGKFLWGAKADGSVFWRGGETVCTLRQMQGTWGVNWLLLGWQATETSADRAGTQMPKFYRGQMPKERCYPPAKRSVG